MRRTATRAISIGCCAVLATAAYAFDWPVDPTSLRFGFGSPRAGFLRGLEFSQAGGLVRAADDGELVFSAAGAALPGGYPLLGGSVVAIGHASQMTSVYTGLEPGSVASYLRNVRKGDTLGSSIEPKPDRGARFYAFDAKERRYLNPLMLLPRLQDDKPPAIRSVAASIDGRESPLDASKPIRQGSYHILVDASDASPAGGQSAPFELRVLVDGAERGRLVYDAAWASGGRSLLFGGKGLPEDDGLTADGRIRFGPYYLSRGRVVLTVAIADHAGNRREQTYSINVQ